MGGAQAAGGACGWGMDWSRLVQELSDAAATMGGSAHGRGSRKEHQHGHKHGHGGGSGSPWFGFGPGGPGPGPWRGGPFGGFFGGGPPWARGPKAKRGDVRSAALALLAEGPHNGYQIIQGINERSGGSWKPSPGAVYPALQQLSDEGLVIGDEADGRRTFRLTEQGRAYVEENREQIGAPWESMTFDPGAEVSDLFKLAAQCSSAMVQIVQTGDDEYVEQAKTVLTDTRRRLYRILAEDGDGDAREDER